MTRIDKKIRYCIADEEFYTREYLHQAIDRLRPDYECLDVADDLQGLEHCIALQPDLLIVSTQLCDGTPTALFGPEGCQIPVIFTSTGYQYELTTRNSNRVAYLLNPVPQSKLEQMICEFESHYYNINKSINHLV